MTCKHETIITWRDEVANPVMWSCMDCDTKFSPIDHQLSERKEMNKYQDYIDRIVTYSRNADKNDAIVELYVKDLISKVKFDSSLDMLNSVLENMKDGTGNNS